MQRQFLAALGGLVISGSLMAAELPGLEDPLQESYELDTLFGESASLNRLDSVGRATSHLCKMGEVVVQGGKFTYEPNDHLEFEVTPRYLSKPFEQLFVSGFVRTLKYGNTDKVFLPVGHYEQDDWVGDLFVTWEEAEGKICFAFGREYSDGYAWINPSTRQGMYYEDPNGQPSYILYDCLSEEVTGLPFYDM